MYLALYRKFRPETFDRVIGQEHIIRTLKNQILNDQIGHAYLFSGSRGTGKTSVAKIFARAVNCVESKDGSPCGICSVCKNLAQTKDIDVIEIDAASNNRVDEVRDLRDKVKYPPLYGRYKVYIIDEVHMLTDNAFNALLKTLEEPPAHIIFILATTEPQRLPATILSRVLRFDFKLVGLEQLSGLLKDIFKESKINAEEKAITLIAQAGKGSVRDALSIADMCASYSNNDIKYEDVLKVLGTSDRDVLLEMTQAILKGDIADFIRVFGREVQSGKNIATLSSDITKQFRDILVAKVSGDKIESVNLSVDTQENLKSVAQKCSLSQINDALQAFSKIESDLKYASNPQLLVEATAVGLATQNQRDKPEPKKEYPQHEQAVSPHMKICLQSQTQSSEKYEIKVENKGEQEQKVKHNPRKVWGQVLTELHNINSILHSACVNIESVDIQGDAFIISLYHSNFIDIIKKGENYADLVACFNKLGYNYKIDIVQQNEVKKKVDKSKLLSQKLGISVKVKNKK